MGEQLGGVAGRGRELVDAARDAYRPAGVAHVTAQRPHDRRVGERQEGGPAGGIEPLQRLDQGLVRHLRQVVERLAVAVVPAGVRLRVRAVPLDEGAQDIGVGVAGVADVHLPDVGLDRRSRRQPGEPVAGHPVGRDGQDGSGPVGGRTQRAAGTVDPAELGTRGGGHPFIRSPWVRSVHVARHPSLDRSGRAHLASPRRVGQSPSRDRPPTMSALPDDDARLTAEAICAARQAVDEATRQLDELTSRLSDRQAELDHVETVLDAVLAVSATPLVVVDAEPTRARPQPGRGRPRVGRGRPRGRRTPGRRPPCR